MCARMPVDSALVLRRCCCARWVSDTERARARLRACSHMPHRVAAIRVLVLAPTRELAEQVCCCAVDC